MNERARLRKMYADIRATKKLPARNEKQQELIDQVHEEPPKNFNDLFEDGGKSVTFADI